MSDTCSRTVHETGFHPQTIGVDLSWTVRDVVSRYPASVVVFKAFRVEACCDADRLLGDAAARAGITGESLLEALTDSFRPRP